MRHWRRMGACGAALLHPQPRLLCLLLLLREFPLHAPLFLLLLLL